MRSYVTTTWIGFLLYNLSAGQHANSNTREERHNIAKPKKTVTPTNNCYGDGKQIFLRMDTNEYSNDELEEIVSNEMPRMLLTIDRHIARTEALHLSHSPRVNGLWKGGNWKPKAGCKLVTSYYRPSEFHNNRLETIPENEVSKKLSSSSSSSKNGNNISVSVLSDRDNLPFDTEQVPFAYSWGMTIEILE